MALTSPGVQVSVIDESFYTSAQPGTVPMLLVASAQDKANASGTGIAQGTRQANAGNPYLVTSQRDLVELFGEPVFYTDTNNNPIHGGELNEYGLQAAYSLLGVSNRAYIVRADIDLASLTPSANAPAANPQSGEYWFDISSSLYGIFEWNGNAVTTTNGQTFTNKTPRIINAQGDVVNFSGGDYTPKASIGAIGEYALVTVTSVNKLWYKNSAGTWVTVGSSAWTASWPTVRSGTSNPTINPADSFNINGTPVTGWGGNSVTDLASYINSLSLGAGGAGAVTAAVVDNRLELYSAGNAITIGAGTGTILSDLDISAATFQAPALQISTHTNVPQFKVSGTNNPTGSIWIKTTQPNGGAKYSVKRWNATTSLWETLSAPIYATNHAALYGLDVAGGGKNLPVGSLYIQSNPTEDSPTEASFKIMRRAVSGDTAITSSAITGLSITGGAGGGAVYNFDIQESIVGNSALNAAITVSFTATNATTDAEDIAAAINSAGFVNIVASVDSSNKLTISHTAGGEFRIADTDGALALIGYTAYNNATSTGTPNLYAAPAGDTTNDFVATNWNVLSYTASSNAPTSLTDNNTLWYNSVIDEVDIMVHNGTTWVGYLDSTSPYYAAQAGNQTDPAGPIVSATQPEEQSDGSDLKEGDIWIDTSDLENYPRIYKYNVTLLRWIEVDTSDQTTEDGILFADARWTNAGYDATNVASSITDLLVSNYLDPDAPDPALYPRGMLLWNTRRSGFNVKRFVRNYIDLTTTNPRFNNEDMNDLATGQKYYPHRWVTESANQADGSGSFGRNAQRKVIVQALQAEINSNEEIRDEQSKQFNIIATPGYSELIGEMVTLNYDRGLTAFVLGDSPARLTSDATSLSEWSTNVNQAVEDNANGLVSFDEYLAVFYPWGITSDNAGNNIVVPPSHMMLRTIALSDQVSFPWFAPAGTRRGNITNATAAGFVNSEGEFVSISLNEGQRDTLYSNKVNPISFLTGAGLVNFGQKTRAPNDSALDRINVARLVIYLRSQLQSLSKPFIFEPNDKITRDEIKQATESLLLELVGQRALYDFLVVCDETNNTPARIDRNELYLDIAIEPVKAVEFIYIPLRLKNTGEIAAL